MREYWHSGHLFEFLAADLQTTGKPTFYLGGISNGYNSGVMIALDPDAFGGASREEKPDYQLLLNWALADDCLNRPAAALDKLQRAVKLKPAAHAYSQIGMVLAKQRRLDEALTVLNKAIETDPHFGASYVYRGNVYVLSGNIAGAVADYRRALEIDPNNQAARNALGKIEARLRGVQ